MDNDFLKCVFVLMLDVRLCNDQFYSEQDIGFLLGFFDMR